MKIGPFMQVGLNFINHRPYAYRCNKDGLITHLRNNNKQKLPNLSLKILELISPQQTS